MSENSAQKMLEARWHFIQIHLFIQFPVDHLGLKHIGDEETSALCQNDKKSPHS